MQENKYFLPNLAGAGEKWSQALLDYGRRLHQAEMQRLMMLHRGGVSGREVVTARAQVMDHLIKQIFAHVGSKGADPSGGRQRSVEGIAIVALGGYGRGELAPFSDIDLMFLTTPKFEAADNKLIQKMLTFLWDMGFDVGHSVRTPRAAMEMGQSDLISLASMLEVRLITGAEELFKDYRQKFGQLVLKLQSSSGRELLKSIRDRHLKQGGTAFIQEPNVKEAKGGLRDFHSVGWLCRLVYPEQELLKALARHGISEQEYKEAVAAYDFMLRLRNELHFLSGRHNDVLSHDLVEEVIKALPFKRHPFQNDSESFLQHYYHQARRISFVLEAFWEGAAGTLQFGSKWPQLKLLTGAGRKGKKAGQVLQEFKLTPSPQRALEVFLQSQEAPESFSEEARLAIRQAMPQFPPALWSTPGVAAVFGNILQQRGKVGPAIRKMHELGFLGKLLPEFGRLTCLVEQDRYHKYTTDEHTLKALEFLDQIIDGRLPHQVAYQKVFNEVANSACLYLALLLHDVGKGLGGSHASKGAKLAVAAMTRLGFNAEAIETVEFLVSHHLLLSHTSQRREINDPETMEHLAGAVKRLDWLNMLLLLTYADLQAVGPDVWTEWKDYLLWQLYYKAYDRLMFDEAKNGKLAQEVEPVRQRIEQLLEKKIEHRAIEEHFRLLPAKYVLYTPLAQVEKHLEMIKRLGDAGTVVDWISHPGRGYTDLLVVARDHPGLFAQIAGGLAAFNLTILSAQLNTRKDKIVCDVFQVSSRVPNNRIPKEDFPRIEKALKKAIAGQWNFVAQLHAPARGKKEMGHPGSLRPRIRMDNDVSPTATVVEIQAEDRVGLGYQIARVLAQLQLNITFAKLATEKAQALDVFYVTEYSGKKVRDPRRIATILEQLQERLSEPPASS